MTLLKFLADRQMTATNMEIEQVVNDHYADLWKWADFRKRTITLGEESLSLVNVCCYHNTILIIAQSRCPAEHLPEGSCRRQNRSTVLQLYRIDTLHKVSEVPLPFFSNNSHYALGADVFAMGETTFRNRRRPHIGRIRFWSTHDLTELKEYEVVHHSDHSEVMGICLVRAAGPFVAVLVDGMIMLFQTLPGHVVKISLPPIIHSRGRIISCLLDDNWLVTRSRSTFLLDLTCNKIRRYSNFKVIVHEHFRYPWVLEHPTHFGGNCHVTHVRTGNSIWKSWERQRRVSLETGWVPSKPVSIYRDNKYCAFVGLPSKDDEKVWWREWIVDLEFPDSRIGRDYLLRFSKRKSNILNIEEFSSMETVNFEKRDIRYQKSKNESDIDEDQHSGLYRSEMCTSS